MKYLHAPALFTLLLLAGATARTQQLTYPSSPKDSVTDNYFGDIVSDPYRWLENDTAEKTKEWVSAENLLSGAYLRKLLNKFPFENHIRFNTYMQFGKLSFGSAEKEGHFFIDFIADETEKTASLYLSRNIIESPVLAVNRHPKIFYHKLGTMQNEDQLVFADTTGANTSLQFSVTGGERYLVISYDIRYKGNGYQKVSFIDFQKDSHTLTDLIFSPNYYRVIGLYNGKFLVSSHGLTPNGALSLVSPDEPDQLEEFIPEHKEILKKTSIIGDKIICIYLDDIDNIAIKNVFDDFIAAAEYLKNQHYTCKEKLAIMGGSNGGLLIGAVLNQRPDLCQVAVAEKGIFDMLRYQKFTIGPAWINEFGTSDDSTQFNYLYKYSPLQNVRKLAYPATLIITADHDDRVVPMHSYKFVATLQEKNTAPTPVLLLTEKNYGHTDDNIKAAAAKYAFIYEHLRVPAVSLPLSN